MRIAVFGAGGVGGYFGGRLAEAGEDVAFISRGAHLQAIQRSGLQIESSEGNFVIQQAQAHEDPAAVGPVDVVLVGVKAWQVPRPPKPYGRWLEQKQLWGRCKTALRLLRSWKQS